MAKNINSETNTDFAYQDWSLMLLELTMHSLYTDDVKSGVNESLSMFRHYLNSSFISIFAKNDNNKYVFKRSDSNMSGLIYSVGCIINKSAHLVENRNIYSLDLNLSDRMKNLMLIHTRAKGNDCIVAILNYDPERVEQIDNYLKAISDIRNNNDLYVYSGFWEYVRQCFTVILKRAYSYEINTKAITTDLLTNADNRNSYELRLQEIDEASDNIVFGIFDLFRLKYVNDNYSHDTGDIYIKEVAKILLKYWPKYKVIINDDMTESLEETGHVIYRIGGDEFVLITTKENLQLASIKAGLVADEVKLIDLGSDDIKTGINFGVVKHISKDSIKDTYKRADEIMNEDKKQMYKDYGLERRL